MEARNGQLLNRRTAIPLVVAGLAAAVAGCEAAYDYEPPKQQKGNASPVSQGVDQMVSYHNRQDQLGERITAKTADGSKLMYINPTSARAPLDESKVLFRDFRVKRHVGGAYGGMVEVRNREFVLVADEVRATNAAELNVSLANSKGSQSIGRHRVYDVAFHGAGEIFHPDQLSPDDSKRRIMTFTIEPDYSGGSGQNVWRVLDNDHQIIIESKNPDTGIPFRRDVYQVKAAN